MKKPEKKVKSNSKQRKKGLSQGELAKALKVTQPYISKLVRSGKIAPECIYKDGTINAVKARKILDETLRPVARKGTQKEAARTSKVSAYYGTRADHESLKLELTRLDLEERRGVLIHKDLVKAVMVNAATVCKQKLLAIPTNAAQDVLGATSIDEIILILRRHVRNALEDLSTHIPGIYKLNGQDGMKPEMMKKKKGNSDAGRRPH